MESVYSVESAHFLFLWEKYVFCVLCNKIYTAILLFSLCFCEIKYSILNNINNVIV